MRAMSCLMIVLLVAQAGGLCQAFVCNCSGSPEVTFADDCHDANAPDCCKDIDPEPCSEGSEPHRHEPLAGQPLTLAAGLIAAAIPVAIRELLPFEQAMLMRETPLRIQGGFCGGVASDTASSPPACRLRQTVAMLI